MTFKSPFRYPGGKSRLAKRVVSHLSAFSRDIDTYVEPFVGGGSILLAVAQKYPYIKDFVVNDFDQAIAAFWTCITDKHMAEDLAKQVEQTTPTVELFADCKETLDSPDTLKRAFSCLVRNRCAFSGRLESGPIGGYAQTNKGIVSRWNGAELARRIRSIHGFIGSRLNVNNNLANTVVLKYGDSCKNLIYLDPPYFEKGNELYRVQNTEKMHFDLARALMAIQSSWIMSYDANSTIVDLYKGGIALWKVEAKYCISVKKRPEKTELIIVRGNKQNVIRKPVLTKSGEEFVLANLFDEKCDLNA